MKTLSRRRFVQGLGLTVGASCLRTPFALADQLSVRAWGTMPDFPIRGPVWNKPPNTKILEVHLYGGLSPWETFYVRPPGRDRYRGFEAEITGLDETSQGNFRGRNTARLFEQDALGHDIFLGPMTRPLWAPQILDKTRLVVLKHDLRTHEEAIPYALTGFRAGSPKLAGLGAAVQRHVGHSDYLRGVSPAAPHAYLFQPKTFKFNSENLRAGTATGSHPSYARPASRKVGDDRNENMPARAIRYAAELLSRPGPRYVGVVDKGLKEHPMGGGYDTHSAGHEVFTAMNVSNVLSTLRQLIDNGSIDLNETMIVLTTEFGRTPSRRNDGRDHWPAGYVNVLIGGPVERGVSGAIQDSRYRGTPDDQDGVAHPEHHFNPADLRAAILVAANVYPFERQGYGLRDISFANSGSSRRELMMRLKTEVLGAPRDA